MRGSSSIAGLFVAGCLGGAALGVAACGSDGESPATDRRAAVDAVEAAQRAFMADDTQGLCALLSRTGRQQAGVAAHGQAKGCRRDLPVFFALIEEGGGWRHRGEPRATAVEVSSDGKRARVRMALGGWKADVPLAREQGGWKLDSFFGTRPRKEDDLARAVYAEPRPAGREVDALGASTDGDSGPCSDVTIVNAASDIFGGCLIYAVDSNMDLSVLTAFGDFRFGGCGVAYDIAIDAAGRTVVDGVDLTPGEGESRRTGCSDIDPCEVTEDPKEPGSELVWKGRITPLGDGAFRHRFNACFDTCVGFYRGTIDTRLVRRGGRWQAVADRAAVGTSGFRFDGRSRPSGAGVDLRAAAGA